jgi:hypothetical protein
MSLTPAQMDSDGLEAIPTAQMVRLLRLALGFHRNHSSHSIQLGRSNGVSLLPRNR